MIQETIGAFGFHLSREEDLQRPVQPNVRLYVKSSSMSRAADLAISPQLVTADDIDGFIDDAISALESLRRDAKRALSDAIEN